MKNQTTQNTNLYKDIDFNLTKHPLTNDVAVKSDANAIEQSLKSLLATSYYERFFQPEVGSNIRAILFEPADPITATDLRSAISNLIRNYEPRVNLINITIEDNSERNAYNIMLTYSFANAPSPVTLKVLLERLR